MKARAVAFAALAAASALVALPRTWDTLADTRAAFGHMSRLEADREAGRHHRQDARVWDFYDANLRPGDRYYLRLPEGDEPRIAYQRIIVGAYASYRLLPSIRVADVAAADVVLTYRVAAPRATCLRNDASYCVRRRR